MQNDRTRGADVFAHSVRLAVVEMGGAWRLFIGTERLGRFARHDDALRCALEIARETRGEGMMVEVLDQTTFGEVTRIADDRLH
jgi:hypothetical protein